MCLQVALHPPIRFNLSCPPNLTSTQTRTVTRRFSNSISMQPSHNLSRTQGPPKLTLLIPPSPGFTSLASGRAPGGANSTGGDTFTPSALAAPNLYLYSSSSSEVSSSPSPESQSYSLQQSASPYYLNSNKHIEQTSHPRPISATLVARTLLSRRRRSHSNPSHGFPWGALRSTCVERRYVESGLRVELSQT